MVKLDLLNLMRRPERPTSEQTDFRAQLETQKRESSVQLLFKVARLLDEEAIRRVAKKKGTPQLRRAHTSLLPHIALEGTRVTELADKLGITKQAVSQLLDDLEGWGVIARVPDPQDGRAKLVLFTKRGREGLLEGLGVLRALEVELAQHVGDKRMRQLHDTLLALHDQLVKAG